MSRIVSWFSCGNNSAVASKLTLQRYPDDEVVIARCIVENEHEDNERFHADVERWLGRPILRLHSDKYRDCWDVWERRHYMAGIHGAVCTLEMKKKVRQAFEREWNPDFHVFGFSADEAKRLTNFRQDNPEIPVLNVLGEAGIVKADCAMLIEAAGIKLPEMYGMGYANNNCIGCVKATSIVYWARTRHFFPEQFARMATLSRQLGCRLTRLKGKRIFLDEIPADVVWQKPDRVKLECGLFCAAA